MANANNIKMSPEQMEQKAAEFDSRNAEFNELISKMSAMVEELKDEWDGQSSIAFYEQYKELEPSFNKASELVKDIAIQLRNISATLQEVDVGIANKITV